MAPAICHHAWQTQAVNAAHHGHGGRYILFNRESQLIGLVEPAPVAKFIAAANQGDLDSVLAAFADDALVNDQLCEYRGKPAIADWARRDVIGDQLRITVVKRAAHYGATLITAHIDGSYDKRGLPEPLVLALYFFTWDERIVQLIMLRNITAA